MKVVDLIKLFWISNKINLYFLLVYVLIIELNVDGYLFVLEILFYFDKLVEGG